jgi:hypothetical protein
MLLASSPRQWRSHPTRVDGCAGFGPPARAQDRSRLVLGASFRVNRPRSRPPTTPMVTAMGCAMGWGRRQTLSLPRSRAVLAPGAADPRHDDRDRGPNPARTRRVERREGSPVPPARGPRRVTRGCRCHARRCRGHALDPCGPLWIRGPTVGDRFADRRDDSHYLAAVAAFARAYAKPALQLRTPVRRTRATTASEPQHLVSATISSPDDGLDR